MKKPLSSFHPSVTPASNRKSCAKSDAVLFSSINGFELAKFLVRSTSLALTLEKLIKKRDKKANFNILQEIVIIHLN